MRLTTHPLLALVIGFLGMDSAVAIEEPKYEVRISQAPFELRHYAPTLIAQTIVEGDMDEASNKGFRLIADFIFGNNLAANSEQAAKIAMTAPVMARVQEKTDETLAWTKQQSLKVMGTPQLSRYAPPWTLPMFRRNEIMVEVAAP
jgi:hypothetical protein